MIDVVRKLAEGRLRYDPDRLLFGVDLAGTFVFAIEGAMAAVKSDLDFFGLMVVAFATALGGGVIRDLLIGAIPPRAILDWRYATVAFSAAAVVFLLHHPVSEISARTIMILDAAGLALFAVSGAGKALEFGVSPFMAILMGAITGVGGGTIRDILLGRVPAILRVDIYAVAALVGAAVMIGGIQLGKPRPLMDVLGGVICFLLRVVSVWQNWNLPKVRAMLFYF